MSSERLTLPRYPVDESAETILGALAEHGLVVVEGVLDRADLSSIRPEIDGLLASAALGDNAFDGYRTRRVFDPLRRTRALDDVVLNPVIHRTIGAALRWPYQFGMTILSQVTPGEVAQRPHRDANVYPLPREFPEIMVNTIWALDDFTEANGATMVAPGSHRDPERRQLTPAVMPAGAVLVYSGRLLHAAGANRSDRTRLGFIVEHVARWLRPAENHPVTVGADLAATLPQGLQELLGFNQTSEYFGFINGRPPSEWLAQLAGE